MYMNRTLRYFGGIFLQPRKTLRSLHHDPQRVSFGFLGVLILAASYFTGISISIALHVMHFPKYLVINIPVEQYYSYERFFILPMGLAGVILASGVIRLVAQWMKGQGSYEDLFALHVYLATLWYLLLTILSVKEVERLSWGRSILIALIGFIANGIVSFIFIR